ncbi:hypothetical protein [Nitrobacter sp. TKz-YC02]|uniref:hypothetical protein n=1 Tax=Nitrobacter sp. TKz-YC02 TaxID=3398704 RepID=UPI003CE72076
MTSDQIVYTKYICKSSQTPRQHFQARLGLREPVFADAMVLSGKAGRYRAIGKDRNGVICVVFATLGREGISVISMRPASKEERILYNEISKK